MNTDQKRETYKLLLAHLEQAKQEFDSEMFTLRTQLGEATNPGQRRGILNRIVAITDLYKNRSEQIQKQVELVG